jgi:hypothetical protein
MDSPGIRGQAAILLSGTPLGKWNHRPFVSNFFSKARAMMKHADLPNITWRKAVLHVVYLKNRSPSTSMGISPPSSF